MLNNLPHRVKLGGEIIKTAKRLNDLLSEANEAELPVIIRTSICTPTGNVSLVNGDISVECSLIGNVAYIKTHHKP